MRPWRSKIQTTHHRTWYLSLPLHDTHKTQFTKEQHKNTSTRPSSPRNNTKTQAQDPVHQGTTQKHKAQFTKALHKNTSTRPSSPRHYTKTQAQDPVHQCTTQKHKHIDPVHASPWFTINQQVKNIFKLKTRSALPFQPLMVKVQHSLTHNTNTSRRPSSSQHSIQVPDSPSFI